MDYDYINQLNKPFLQPQPIVFKIVWPILYVLMFLSLYVFLKEENNTSKMQGVVIFIIQLCLNLVWSPVFFYYKKIFLALCISVLLTIAAGIMIVHFYKESPLAGWLNIPYFVWLLFADYLNLHIWFLNRS